MVDKDMNIMDIIIKYPKTKMVFEKFKMGCSGCMGAINESLEAGARMHGINLDTLLEQLNEAISQK